MSLIINDRVLESSTSVGTGNMTLDGAIAGFQEFGVAIGVGNDTWYCIESVDANGRPTGDWEVGAGKVALGELQRTSVFSSSNSNNPVNFSAGTKRVFCNVPATQLIKLKDLPGPGTGTVTDVSVVTANGFSGTVANSTTTPAITISISNSATIRTALGLGSAALANTTDFDSAGAAAAAYAAAAADLAAHVAAPDPHPQYLTTAEGNALYQPLDATLTAFAALTIAANSITVGTGADAFTQLTLGANTFPARSSAGDVAAKTISDFALTILDDAAASDVRTTIGLGNVDNTSDVNKPVSTAQQAAIDAAVVGLWDFKGTKDCSTNPNYPAALKGDTYIVSVAGKIGGASGVVTSVGDIILCLADNAGGTQAAVGTSWAVLEANIPGITTVGLSLVTLANPSAISFIRIDADNTVIAQSAANYRVSILPSMTGNSLKGIRINAGETDVEYFTPATAATSADGSITPTASDVVINPNWLSPFALINGYVTASVASNNLTIAIKNAAGTDPSSSNPVKVVFRNATMGTGDYTVLTLTAATSLTITNGSSLGAPTSTATRIWVVGFNDGGTFRLGAVNCLKLSSGLPVEILYLRDDTVHNSVAEGGIGGADLAEIIYTGTAVTSKSLRVLAYLEFQNGLAVAGQWNVAPEIIQQFGHGVPLPGDILHFVVDADSSGQSGTTILPLDNTIPQDTEGVQFLSVTIHPNSPCNLFRIQVNAIHSISTANAISGAIFRSGIGDTNAIVAAAVHPNGLNNFAIISLDTLLLIQYTSDATYNYRAGNNVAGTIYMNKNGSTSLFNGRCYSELRVQEIMA